MSWLQTYTGRRIELFDPRPEQIDIEDIAHALAHECRYAGHVKEFYSVAQHSVIVSRLCEPQDALWGLLHDGAEAYLGDVVKPLKVTGAFAAFREMEMRMQLAICSRFGLPPEEPASVKRIDKSYGCHRSARPARAVAPGLGRSDLPARHRNPSTGSSDGASVFSEPVLRVMGRLRIIGESAAWCRMWARASRG